MKQEARQAATDACNAILEAMDPVAIALAQTIRLWTPPESVDGYDASTIDLVSKLSTALVTLDDLASSVHPGFEETS